MTPPGAPFAHYEQIPIYFGITRHTMRARLRLGWTDRVLRFRWRDLEEPEPTPGLTGSLGDVGTPVKIKPAGTCP
jgi:hypothetical protein